MIFDACLLYGQSNKFELSKMFERVFKIQPMYNEDIKNAIVFVDEVISWIILFYKYLVWKYYSLIIDNYTEKNAYKYTLLSFIMTLIHL